MQPVININDYNYPLPEERIAKFPLENRDDSKLLINIERNHDVFLDEKFTNISSYLPCGSLMVFNNTKVVPARLIFKKDTGAVIEIFCLEPKDPVDYQVNFLQTEKCRWKAIVGNVKRWKSGLVSLYTEHLMDNKISDVCDDRSLYYKGVSEIDLKADLVDREGNVCIIEFSWHGGYSFSKVMELCGRMPIPPYLKRETEHIDYERYQTMYAKLEGSVAAPTAGLHFTQRELDNIDNKDITRANLCLHVGAGTFLPVKSQYISDHTMHSEPFSVSKSFIETLYKFISSGKEIISVGTTSTRCLESLYFLGVHCIEKGEPGVVTQWEPYRDEGYEYSSCDAIKAIIKYLNDNCLNSLTSRTSLIIVPGYKFNFVTFLVTNFHQPQSTLLLLISAFVGENWRDMYRFALDNSFRFLSYGDSSLLKR